MRALILAQDDGTSCATLPQNARSSPCGLSVVSLLQSQSTETYPLTHCLNMFLLYASCVIPEIIVLSLVQVKGGKCLYTCSLRPTGIYGEGHELIKDFYKQGVQRGGLIIGGVPENSEHGRVYAGKFTVFSEAKPQR